MQQQGARACPSCGSPVSAGDAFCGNCGAPTLPPLDDSAQGSGIFVSYRRQDNSHLAGPPPLDDSAQGSGIFVSYRRQDSSHLAGRLYDRLADRFGEDQVFIDVDTIEPGVDFAEEIFRAVAACTVLLAVIGPGWLTAADEGGGRRLDDPDDIVRLEIEAALARGVRVIPILVEGAVMPRRQDLPDSLGGLARRQ